MTETPAEEDKYVDQSNFDSTNLKSGTYNRLTDRLVIRFQSGAVYTYEDVPDNVWEELKSARSHGKYFNRMVKDRFEYERK